MSSAEEYSTGHEAIKALAAAYSDAVNRKNSADMASVFTEDGQLSAFGTPDVVGRPAIEATYKELLGEYVWLFQTICNGTISIDANQAFARWWVTEYQLREDGRGGMFLGCYQDDMLLGDDGWRFTRRTLNAIYLGRTEFVGKSFPQPEYRVL